MKDEFIQFLIPTPHLFKSLRNHLKRSNFIFECKEVSFQDLRDVYDIDKKSCTSRSLLKITDNHINPGPFQLMSCKLAMQLFSNTMSTAIIISVYTGQLKSTTAIQTANMI